jgi:hypothetical protein
MEWHRMDAAFGQLIATLEKAQDTMGPQLDRLSRARVPDSIRVPRLRAEAKQFKAAAAGLLARLRQRERDIALETRLESLVAFFALAERQAASLLRKGPDSNPEPSHEPDDGALFDEEAPEEPARRPGQAVHMRPGARIRSRSAPYGLRL